MSSYLTKLTDEDCFQIRKRYIIDDEFPQDIAPDYNVSAGYCKNIINMFSRYNQEHYVRLLKIDLEATFRWFRWRKGWDQLTKNKGKIENILIEFSKQEFSKQ